MLNVKTKVNVGDRDVLHELLELLYIDTLFVDKAQELRDEKGIKLCALKRANSKNHLPKEFRNMISKLRRRIQTMFNQMIEHFDIKCVSANSIIDGINNVGS